jgi:diaminopimelate epimerase
MIGIRLIENHQSSSSTDFRNNDELIHSLIETSTQSSHRVDSIMVLSDLHINQNYHVHMDVFEPHAGERGAWSTMCGNGIIAVAQWLHEEGHIAEHSAATIMTRSGIRSLESTDEGWIARMGEGTFARSDLSSYVAEEFAADTEDLFQIETADFTDDISVFLSGDRTQNGINGEPHLIVMKKNTFDVADIHRMAQEIGPRFTFHPAFPQGINCNIVSIQQVNKSERRVRVTAATHERNLGTDPSAAVTAACGTGATAIAATVLRYLQLNSSWKVAVEMPGGILLVHRNQAWFLEGSARHQV